MKLSVIVITKNEAVNLRACLQGVGFASEVIIVDSGSTDGTVALARELGAQVIETTDWPGFGAQKNRALAEARGEWVLSIDADERVTPALREEILRVVDQSDHRAYALPRLSSFCGQFIRHSGWYPDHVVRLWQRGSARFSDHLVHEQVVVERGTTGYLETPLVHYSYRNDSDFLRKLEQYSELGAQQAFADGKRATLRTALSHSLAALLRSFVFKRGFLDGRAGLIVALCAAQTTYHKYFKLMLLTEVERGHRGDADVDPI